LTHLEALRGWAERFPRERVYIRSGRHNGELVCIHPPGSTKKDPHVRYQWTITTLIRLAEEGALLKVLYLQRLFESPTVSITNKEDSREHTRNRQIDPPEAVGQRQRG